jgi:polar amino acid transport system permease protein
VDLDYLIEVAPKLVDGLTLTVLVTVTSMAVASTLGLVVAVGRLLDPPLIGRFLGGFVLFIRNTPLLIQLFFVFYILPSYGVTLGAFETGVLGMGIYISAYTAEVYRAGLLSVPRGQWEAARAVNLGPLQTLYLIVLPQALRPIVPALGNYLISVFKDSSILTTITLYELLGTALALASFSFQDTTLLTAVGIIYLALSYPSSLLVRRLEGRLASAT